MAAPEFRMIAWLRELGFDAHLTPPAGKERFCVVQGLGGSVEDMVDHPSVAIQFYAKSATEAQADAWGLRRQLLTTLPTNGIIRVAVESGPYLFNDPDRTGLTRYQLTLGLTCHI